MACIANLLLSTSSLIYSNIAIFFCSNLLRMELQKPISALVFVLVVVAARIELSTCQVLKGSVTCPDCNTHYDLSGIKVQVKCSNVKKQTVATTREDGTFEAELPSDTVTPQTSPYDCLARILGGPARLYASRKDMVSRISKLLGSDFYAVSAPLKFYTSCPSSSSKNGTGCGTRNAGIDSSKTVNLPLPPEWGLAPSSYYFPFFPIIGIP